MPPETTPGRLRPAVPADAPAIAALHTRSWRASYRGSLSDAYLDGPIEAERAAFWRDRLDHPPPGLVTLLLPGDDDALIGFVCGLVDDDPRWGTLVDNLHVAPQIKGRGLGRLLMRSFGETLIARSSLRPVHLFVLASNEAARGFYLRIGGAVVERLMHEEPDGHSHPIDRIAWPTASAFLSGTA